MTKAELRHEYLSKQTALSQKDRAEKSRAISDLFFETTDLSNIKNLHLFLPIEKFNEVDTRLLAARVWKEFPHIRTIVPRVDFETNELLSLELTPETKLKKNAWQIEEPTGHEVVDAAAIDIVLIPGVCFDVEGHRVGYGKGFYDRFLKTCRTNCAKIGLSYFAPVRSISDVHDGDVRVDRVVTPERVF